jgi:hypothetical protein
MTEQYISAQEWICATCGGHDRKSCGCAGATATSREIQAKVERLAAKHERDRHRAKAYRERKTASRDAPVKNIEESPGDPRPHDAREDREDAPARVLAAPSSPAPRRKGRPSSTSAHAHALVSELTYSDDETRAVAVALLVSGDRQDEFRAAREAVADLYQRLSQAGR